MRAAFLESVGCLELREVETPSIHQPDEVLIQVKTVGVCGSEVHAFEGTHPFRKAPVILGHEMSGVVTAVGDGVKGFQPGQRVLVDPQWSCGTCEHCRAGDINLCPSKRVLGTQSWTGAFGEYIVAPEKSVFHLPVSLSFNQGALIEPLTVAVHVAERVGFGPGKSVAILGSGSIGGMISGVAQAYGMETIIAADIRPHCLDAARERMGATHDFLLPNERFVDQVRALTGGKGVDIAIVAADDVHLVDQALDLVRRRGIVVLVALMTHEPLSFMGFKMIGKETQLVGSTMANERDVRAAIDLVTRGKVDVEGIVTHHLPIEDVQRGMELAATKDDGAIKVLLHF